MKNAGKMFLQIHGTLLLIAGFVMTIIASLGMFKGIGVMNLLQGNPMALVGLMQAYLLMSIIGLVLWFGATQYKRKWHIIGAIAHFPQLLANIIFWDFSEKSGWVT